MNARIVVVVGLGLMASSSAWGGQNPQSYRTQVPKITSDRWTRPLPPLPKRRTITKADYLKYIQEKWTSARIAAKKGRGKADVPQQYRSARNEAFVYKVTGNERYAKSAMEFIRGDYRYRTEGTGTNYAGCCVVTILPSMLAYHWIRDSGSLTAADHALVRKWLQGKIDNYAYYENGAMNRGVGGSACVKVANQWYPDTADQPLKCVKVMPWLKAKPLTRKQYVDSTWPMWWDFRDFYENSSGYVSHTLEMVMTTWEMLGTQELHNDPGMEKLARRYLAQITPIGAMPGYGDVVGFNCEPGRWILFMETWAKAHNDGQFKWAAHRMFEFLRQHEKEYYQWGNPIYDTMATLMEAYLVADDSIKPVEPTIGSVMTQRHDLRWVDSTKTGRHADQVDRIIPNKLMLRSGWDADDAYAMVELCKPMSHGHGSTASIECLIVDGSVLLAAPPYIIRSHRHHNSFVAWPDTRPAGFNWKRQILNGGRCAVTVPTFHKTAEKAYAHVRVTDYMNGPTTLDRRIFFLGKQGLWVRDTVTGGSEEFRGTIGPAYQFVGVYPKRGNNWVNACQTSVPVAFIWKPEYMMQFKNRPMDLLVYFMPKSGSAIAIDDVRVDASGLHAGRGKVIPNNFTDRVWYQMKTTLAKGQRHTFDSILLPHKPMQDATPLAEGIQSLLDDGPGRAVMQVKTPGGQTLYVGINAYGKPITAGPVTTDAKWFLVEVRSDGGAGYWLVEGTSLKVDGREVFTASERETVDKL